MVKTWPQLIVKITIVRRPLRCSLCRELLACREGHRRPPALAGPPRGLVCRTSGPVCGGLERIGAPGRLSTSFHPSCDGRAWSGSLSWFQRSSALHARLKLRHRWIGWAFGERRQPCGQPWRRQGNTRCPTRLVFGRRRMNSYSDPCKHQFPFAFTPRLDGDLSGSI